MIESKKKWMINRPNQKYVDTLVQDLGLSSVHAKILVSRGITDSDKAKAFLHMDISTMHDPFLLYEMDKAVAIIQQAISSNKKIAVYGDYDADGVTSVAVLTTALECLGADVFFAIPNRFKHGYGPNKELFLELYEKGTSLIITVDNGISGIDAISYAKSLGMDVIVTDHHEIGEVLPPANVVIHPRHPEGDYPFGELAGVGVAFKLASALLDEAPLELLELVAIGTVADLVPLVDENRYFVKEGIKRMRTSKRPAIQALARVASTDQSLLTEESLGFTIGPRLNAAGRLGDADPAVDLLKSEDLTVATAIAKELDLLNKERQAIVAEINLEAEEMITAQYGDNIPLVFVIAAEGWNPGVIGIVSSRITEKYHRPSIVLNIDNEAGTAKGSARSIGGFDLYKELSKNAHLLPHYGGHQMAAGMTLAISDIDVLSKNLNEQAAHVLTDEMLVPELTIDVPLTLAEIDVEVLESLDFLRPFGMEFAKPVYVLEDVIVENIRKIGADKNHLKLELTGNNQTLDSIGFGLGDLADQLTPGLKISVVGDLQVNEWNGNKKPQILLKDIQTNEWQLFDLRGMREPSRWLHTIPEKGTQFFAFNQETVNHFQTSMKGIAIQLYNNVPIQKANNLVLLDIPDDEKKLLDLLSIQQPNRIYAHFFSLETKYFDGFPSREQFGWYYSFLKKRGEFDIGKNGQQLTTHKGWKKDAVYFMSKVFSELGFVKIDNGLATIIENAGKRELSEAPSYKERAEQIELEKKLLYAPYVELKEWFGTLRN